MCCYTPIEFSFLYRVLRLRVCLFDGVCLVTAKRMLDLEEFEFLWIHSYFI